MMFGPRRWIGIAVVCAVGAFALLTHQLGVPSRQVPLVPPITIADGPVPSREPPPGLSARLSLTRVPAPARTVVSDIGGRTLAVFTDGARSVRLTGPSRTLQEPAHTSAVVTTDAWVRLAPVEWRSGAEQAAWFRPWLTGALSDRSPDVLAVAMEYIGGAKVRRDGKGRRIAGDADFGPLSDIDPDGRAENSDFYDYLGVSWTSPVDGKKEKPSRAHARSLDCSGYLRMVYGYRMGYPLRGSNTEGIGLPRRAYAMAAFGPGVQLMPNTGRQARRHDVLLPGDLLFFSGGPVQNTHIEHSGMYLGVDSVGHHRFISSRTTANGPTMGDLGGASMLDGSGHWAARFRTARRL